MTVDAETLRRWLEDGILVSILDVRPLGERAEWSIPGSLHVDAYDALRANDPRALDSVSLPREQPVVTVCAAGRTSLRAAEILRARGHTVYSLEGGMRAWTGAWNTAEVPAGVPGVRIIQIRRTGKGCLSYMVAADGEAAVIDASVDPRVYTDIAKNAGWKIAAVIETHVHADHVSRAIPLCRDTGALLHVPEQKRVSFPYVPVRHGHTIPLGALPDAFTALRTPGHTEESTCYILGEGKAVFTEDTLFLGGVGRPDLEGGPAKADSLSRALHRSLGRLQSLPDDSLVLPSHTGAPVDFDGIPLCGPLRQVRRQNRLLGLPEEEFVASILARIPPVPPNFGRIMDINESGRLPESDPSELEAGSNRCAVS